jgi:hypothetical protein
MLTNVNHHKDIMKVYKIFQVHQIKNNFNKKNKVYRIPTRNITKLQHPKIFLIIPKNKLFHLLIQ